MYTSHEPLPRGHRRIQEPILIFFLQVLAICPTTASPPTGNAITSPGLNEQVPEGAPYHIKWEPTLGKTVSLVLLRGPSSNVVPLQTIVEDIPNSGEYTWTPPSNLEVDTTHYGILLVVEGTGAYQWSTQFGIAKGASSGPSTVVTVIDDKTTTYCPEEASSTAAPTPSAPASSAPATIVTVIDDKTTTYCPEEASSTASETSSGVAPVTTAPVTTPAPWVPSSSLTRRPLKPSSSVPVVPVVPSGTATATPSAPPAFNAAGRTTMSFGVVAAAFVALMAF
ncbi:GPI anchored serine-threonine rich protein [Penicillium chermesinum]|nr:GPI anchored serine-threonine rich protein [Penicillium chermesinum]